MKKLSSCVLASLLIVLPLSLATQPADAHLSEKDIAKIANKKLYHKAWRNCDSFLMKGFLGTGIAYAISKYISARTFDLTPHRIYALDAQIAEKTNAQPILSATKLEVDYTNQSFSPRAQGSFLTNNWLMQYVKDNANNKHTLLLSKPHLMKALLYPTIILALADLGVKMKRAADHDSNLISFLFTSFWA